ncbi:MAG TPA: GAF domain-containing sensor histidine kinase [Anaerolineae bacterium]|nr:GAF domain-containing sensor histidine kinase [Anaerolineae bacterium]
MGNSEHVESGLKRRVAHLERLIEISRSLNSTLVLSTLLHNIVEAAQEISNAAECSIMLLDRKSGQLHFTAATNLPGVRAIVVPMEGSVAGWVVKHGEPLVVTDPARDPRFHFSRTADAISDFETHTILAVPLIARDEVIGVLEAVNKQDGENFTQEDVELLSVLGNQAAVAVQNAILFQQSDLISEIVHEMRTPLTSVIAYADLMQRPEITKEQCAQFAAIVQREAARISEMTTNFLDLARLESGRASIAQDEVDLSTVILMAINVILPQAESKDIEVAVDVPVMMPPVRGDAQRLHQVMLNLLSNAVKYCREGDKITVTARAEEDHLVVSVSDTGPGIPADSLPHIFERFYRVPGTEKSVVGTGLGLSITQQIVEAHGGEITVESEEGHGTTFTFTLPRMQS